MDQRLCEAFARITRCDSRRLPAIYYQDVAGDEVRGVRGQEYGCTFKVMIAA
jgi:hypothetical protein